LRHADVWEHVFDTLVADSDNSYRMIDSTIVRAHPVRTSIVQTHRKGDGTSPTYWNRPPKLLVIGWRPPRSLNADPIW